MADITLQQRVNEIERRIQDGTLRLKPSQAVQLAKWKRELAQQRQQQPAAQMQPSGGYSAGSLQTLLNAVGGALGMPPAGGVRIGGARAGQPAPRGVAQGPIVRFGEAPGHPKAQLQFGDIPPALEAMFNAAVAGSVGSITGAQLAARVVQQAPRLAKALPLITEMASDFLARKYNVSQGLEEPGAGGDVLSILGAPSGRFAFEEGRAALANIIPKMRSGRYTMQELARNTNRMIRQDMSQAAQQLKVDFEGELDTLINETADIVGVPAETLSKLSPSAATAQIRAAGKAIEQFPEATDRLVRAMQRQLDTLANKADAAAKNAVRATTRQIRRKAAFLRQTRAELDGYLQEARRKAANTVRQQNQAATGTLRQFESNINAPTEEAVTAAYDAVTEYRDVMIPRDIFTEAQQAIRSAQTQLAEEFPGLESRDILSMVRIPTEEVAQEGVEEAAQIPLREVSFGGVQEAMTALGRRISGLKDQVVAGTNPAARETLGVAQTLYKRLQAMLDNAAESAGPAAETLRRANHLNKLKRTGEELSELFAHSIQRDAEGQLFFDARRARKLLGDLDENRVFKERLQQLDLYDGLVSMLDDIATSAEQAKMVENQLRQVKLPRPAPATPRLAPQAAPRTTVPPLMSEAERGAFQRAGQAVQQRTQQVSGRPRTPRRGDFPLTEALPEEMVTRPGTGGEYYRLAIAAGALSGAFAAGSRYVEAGTILLAMLPGLMGYAATSPRGQKVLLKLMQYKGGVLDPGVASSVLGSMVRAGTMAYMSDTDFQQQTAQPGIPGGVSGIRRRGEEALQSFYTR